MGRARDARADRLDAEAVRYHDLAVAAAVAMGAPTSAPYDAHDVAGDALVRWLATGRRGGVSYRSARYRVLDALREHRHSRRVGQLVRVHPRRVQAGRALTEDDQSELADPLDRPAPEPTPEAWAQAHEAAERADSPPDALAVLRELWHTERWTPAVEEQVAAVLERAAAEARATKDAPLRQRIEAWLAQNPGEHTQQEIARALGVRRESVCRAMRG